MSHYRVGIIGCGGRGRQHAQGYAACDRVSIVACADPMAENARRLAEEYQVDRVYDDYREMLERENLDVVSVCTWTGLHHDMIIDSVEAGVRLINAEKPMAPTWGESRAIQQAL